MSVLLSSGYTLLNTDGRAHHRNLIRRRHTHVSIRIKEHLDQDWQEWLEGLQIVHEPDGTSRLLGLLQDQPALYGVLNKISRLSLALLSLESSEAAPLMKDVVW